MSGSIRKRGAGSWELAIETGRDPATGVRVRQYTSFKGNKRDAEKRLTELLSERDRGIDIAPDKVTLGEFLRRWLTEYADTNVARSTAQRYRVAVNKHIAPHIGSLRLMSVRPMHVQLLHGTCLKEGLSPRTVSQHHRILSEALKHAVQWQLLASNPAASVSPPRFERKELAVLDQPGVARLLAAAEANYLHPIIYTALHTGARSGEILALRWSDLDLNQGRLAITRSAQRMTGEGIVFGATKTHRSRRAVTLSAEAVKFLRQHRDHQRQERAAAGASYATHDLVFAQPNGNPYEPGQVSKAFAKLLLRGGLPPIRFHDLRHTAATMLLSAGIHPKVVSERLGHASINITLDTYSHVLPGLQEEAAAAMDAALGLGMF